MLRISLIFLMMVGTARAEPVREVVRLANQYRVQRGLTPMTVSPALEAAAEAHGRDMVQNRFFSHRGSNGSRLGERVRRQRYRYCVISENIAMGTYNAQEVIQVWMNSRGHRRNILKRNVREVGVIRAGGGIWVMVMGTRQGDC